MSQVAQDKVLIELASDYEGYSRLKVLTQSGKWEAAKSTFQKEYPGIELDSLYFQAETGLDCYVIKDVKSEDRAIIYIGSQDAVDWKMNFEMGVNRVPNQYVSALDLAKQYGENLVAVSGNSLAGGEAQFVGLGMNKEIKVVTLNPSSINKSLIHYLESRGTLYDKANIVNYFTNTDVLAAAIGTKNGDGIKSVGHLSHLVLVGENKIIEGAGDFGRLGIFEGHIGSKQMTKYGAFHLIDGSYRDFHCIYNPSSGLFEFRNEPQLPIRIDASSISAVTSNYFTVIQEQQLSMQKSVRRLDEILNSSTARFCTRRESLVEELEHFLVQIPGIPGFVVNLLYSESAFLQFLFRFLDHQPLIQSLFRSSGISFSSMSNIKRKLEGALDCFFEKCAEDLQLQALDGGTTNRSLCDGPFERKVRIICNQINKHAKQANESLLVFNKQFRAIGSIWSIFDCTLSSDINNRKRPKTIETTSILADAHSADRNNLLEVHDVLSHLQIDIKEGILSKRKSVVSDNMRIVAQTFYEIFSLFRDELVVPLFYFVARKKEEVERRGANFHKKQTLFVHENDDFQVQRQKEAEEQVRDHLQQLQNTEDQLGQLVNILCEIDINTMQELLSNFKERLFMEIIHDSVLYEVINEVHHLKMSVEISLKTLKQINSSIWEHRGKAIEDLQKQGKYVEQYLDAVFNLTMTLRL